MNNNISNSKHKMSKIWIIIILVVVMLLGCCFLGAFSAFFKGFMNAKKNDEGGTNSSQSLKKTDIGLPKVESDNIEKLYLLSTTKNENFDNGYILLEMTGYGEGWEKDYSKIHDYYGCFDNNGKLLYYVDNVDEFDDGYSMIYDSDQIKWINPKGDTIFKYSNHYGENGLIAERLCTDMKSILVREHQTGFNENDVYTYKIIDREGSVLFEYEDDTTISPVYLGGGYYYLDSVNAIPQILNAGKPKYGKHDRPLLYNPFSNAYIEAAGEFNALNDDEGYFLSLPYITFTDGTMYNIDDYLVDKSYKSVKIIDKNNFLYIDKKNNTFVFNISDNSFYDCSSPFKDHVYKAYVVNDIIVFLVVGDDNYIYYTIVDIKGNVIQDLAMIPDSKVNIDYIDIPENELMEWYIDYEDSIIKISHHILGLSPETKWYYYDISSPKDGLKDTIDSVRLLKFRDNWAYIELTTDNPMDDGDIHINAKKYHHNWINSKGKYLFKEDDSGNPVISLKETEHKYIPEDVLPIAENNDSSGYNKKPVNSIGQYSNYPSNETSDERTTVTVNTEPVSKIEKTSDTNPANNFTNPYSGFFGSENAPSDMEFYGDSDIKRGVVETESTSLNLRSGPGTDFEVADEIPKGASVEVLGMNNEWCYIRWYTFRENPMGGGNSIVIYGYVSSKYISISE